MKGWSTRLIAMVVTSVVVPLLVEKLGMSMDGAWLIISTVLGWMGVETIRPSGSVGLMGSKGAAPGK